MGISPVQLTASGVDAMTRKSSRQRCWEPQYLGPHQDPSNDAYRHPKGNLASYSGAVAAGSFPVIPPVEWNLLLGGNSLAANPLPTIPCMKERPGEYSAGQAKHFAIPTLASARDQNTVEATASHRTLAGRRAPPYARPPAEAKTQKTKKRKPREKKQVVEKDDPDALAIAAALRREMQACELGHLECGPCHLRRKGELTVTKKSIEHEIHYMLAYFHPSGSQLRYRRQRTGVTISSFGRFVLDIGC
ncbi:hypothetical protein BS47DRAFT_686437 [Hydnum rufescens UP504]|uniref:Uncharacterized protein n=1 Tax=Hydnum rufescens UP504 TaxID=1448309 RepID=A0A9P6DII9_9AGAM|nr:hypothetical protein BS47DRAFT_686437 [Hydnum rufescens UP504]